MKTIKETVDTSVWESVRDSVYIFCLDSAGSSMKTRVWESVKGSVMISVWGSVQESVSKSVHRLTKEKLK